MQNYDHIKLEMEETQPDNKAALDALDRIESLRNESKGVYGYHLSGNLEVWEYFKIDEDFETIRAYITGGKHG